jgi:hypothetical protein
MNQIAPSPISKDTKWIMSLLDNPDSFIHDKGFESLKDTLIRNVTSTYQVDNFGVIYHQEQELYDAK